MGQQLQFASVQAEVDLIKSVKRAKDEAAIILKEDKALRGSKKKLASGRKHPTVKKLKPKKTSSLKLSKKGITIASRLYTSDQLAKLDEWYDISARPEAPEIDAMYRVINDPKYLDKNVQPEGIAFKQ